jgi:ABC-type branched-subunit amino acid transport system ATPase component
VQALQDCTLDVAEGSIAGLIGPNGSGKTTLFNVITGYERVDSGEVWLGGRQLTNQAPDKVFAAGIGRTFQLTRVFSRLTVMENMIVAAQYHERGQGRLRNPLARAGGPATRRRAMELLEFTGIASHAGALAETLSYGQRKLLEMSYVLMASPSIVLLDEPAGGLNHEEVYVLGDLIRKIRDDRKITVLLVEQDVSQALRVASHIHCLLEGRTTLESRPADVTAEQVEAAYFGLAGAAPGGPPAEGSESLWPG